MKRALPYVGLFVAFLLALYVLGGSAADTLYSNSYASCKRGNDIRTELNARIVQHRADAMAMTIFAGVTRDQRLVEFRKTGDRADLAVALAAGRALTIEQGLQFKGEALIDCRAVIKHPSL